MSGNLVPDTTNKKEARVDFPFKYYIILSQKERSCIYSLV